MNAAGRRLLRRFIHVLIVASALALPLALTAPAGAAPGTIAGPGWHKAEADPVTPEQARALRAATPSTSPPPSLAGLVATETEATPEIAALARGLRYDPSLIFDYVHNTIDYVPVYGSMKDATATSYAGRGSDADQASLLIALLRASGINADYVTGDVTYPLARLANWVGAAQSETGNVFASGGVPIAGVSGGFRITRVWVRAYIGGAWVTLDPAMKTYRDIAGLTDLGTRMGYARATFLTNALTGATVTGSSVQNLSTANLRADLAAYSAALVDEIRDVAPTATVADITGGRAIVQETLATYPTVLPYAQAVTNQATTATLPAALRHTLRVQYAGMDRTFNTFQLAARRVTILYAAIGGGTYEPVLHVDGTPVLTGTGAVSGTVGTLTLTADHPYANSGGTYADQQVELALRHGAAYALMHDFDAVSPALIAREQHQVAEAVLAGSAADSEAVLGGSLAVMGLTWLREETLFRQLVERQGDVIALAHHTAGIVGQESGTFFDIPLAMVSTISTGGASDDDAAFRVLTLFTSALEHGVLEQLQGTPAVSTIKMLSVTNSLGITTYVADSANWATVRPLLTSYSAGELAWFDTLIGNAYKLVLPQDGRTLVGAWEGVGYIQHWQSGSSSSMGMIIYGGYNGGYTTTPGSYDPNGTGSTIDLWYNLTRPAAPGYVPTSGEPVEMASGSYLSTHTDWDFGPDAPSPGLRFTRSYNSRGSTSPGSLGYGWSHAYEMSANAHSQGDAGLGARTPVDAASLIAYTHVALDLMTHELTPAGWMASVMATTWAMDQLIDNAITVELDGKAYTYGKLADGTFTPPPGGTAMLTVIANGSATVLERSGERWDFDPQGRITSRRDPNGNATTFTYTGANLTAVTDAWGNTLTLTYTGDRLTGLLHAGRAITFTHDAGGTLASVTDGEGHVWAYTYDAHRRLTQILRADSTLPLITNTYDAFGRVVEQTDALGQVGQFFWGGTRNTERTPDGEEVVYIFDNATRFVGREDQTGARATFTYDGLGRLTHVEDRLGDTITYTHHLPTGRLASITSAKGHTTTYVYTARTGNAQLYDLTRVNHPNGTYDAFSYDGKGNLLTWRDPANAIWTYTYNARGQRLTARNPTGGTFTYTYNTAGLLISATGSNTGVTTFQYDTFRRLAGITHPTGATEAFEYDGNDRLVRYTDTRGAVTLYAYDANGNLTGVTRGAGTGLAQATTYTYNALNQQTQSLDPLGATTAFGYTPLGALETITAAGGATANLHYDPRGWLDGLTDPAGNLWQVTYDAESIPSGVRTPEARTIGLSSDRNGAFNRITDPLGRAYILERDIMDRVIRVTDRLNRQTSLTYDAAGRIKTITLPLVGTVQYTRNGLGLVTELRDLRGKVWTFGYTAMGRIHTVTDPAASVWSYTYDTSGRVATVTYPDGVMEARTYDAGNALTRRQFSDGLTLTFVYDALGRLTGTGSALVSLTYDARDAIVTTTMGGATFGATYDSQSRIETVTYDGLMVVTYTYDPRGLVTRVEDDLRDAWVTLTYDDDGLLIALDRSNGVTTTLARDENGQITRIRHGNKGELVFNFDAEGQITRIIEALPLDVAAFLDVELQTYAYDDANQINLPGFSYDARGRRTQDPRRTYTWDAANRLTTILEGSTTVANTYTALGEVARRTSGGQTTEFFCNYAIDNHPLVAEKRGGAYTHFYVTTPAGRLLYSVDAPQSAPAERFYHFNHLGSTLFLTGATGEVTDAYGYTPYGQMVRHEGTSDQPFTFIGEHGVRQEGSTGLYQMRARFYDSRTIQFLSRDPLWPDLSDPKALNPYQYAGLNPLGAIDPSGEETINLGDVQANPPKAQSPAPGTYADILASMSFGGTSIGAQNPSGYTAPLGSTGTGGFHLPAQPPTVSAPNVTTTQPPAVQPPQSNRESGRKGAEITQAIAEVEKEERERREQQEWAKQMQIWQQREQQRRENSCCGDCSLLIPGDGGPLGSEAVLLLAGSVLVAVWFGTRTAVRRLDKRRGPAMIDRDTTG